MASPAPPSRVAIAIALNESFVPPALALLESIRCHGGNLHGVTLTVLTRGLTQAGEQALVAAAARCGLRARFHIIEDISELGEVPDWAISTCLRLYCEALFRDFDRLLYLDSDVLVLHSLTPLLAADLCGRSAGAVVNHPPFETVQVTIPRSRRGDRLRGEFPYFNAGVLLMDCAKWLEQDVCGQSRAYIAQHPGSRLLDQDALNVALAGDWQSLDMEWNTPAGDLNAAPMLSGLTQLHPSIAESCSRWATIQKNPRILHFTGQPKPWEPQYPWPSLASQYMRYTRHCEPLSWPASTRTVLKRNGEERLREYERG